MLHDIDEPRCVRSLHHLPKLPAQIIAQRRAGTCRRDHRKSVLGSIGIGRAAAGIQIAAPIIAKRRRTCPRPMSHTAAQADHSAGLRLLRPSG